MTDEYYKIKDQCRNGLLKYLEKAVSLIPKADRYRILDIGCGTGVPTLFLAQRFTGSITAIDTDKASIAFLQKKAGKGNCRSKITILNVSFFDFQSIPDQYDIILAEGFLNVVGFEKGFIKMLELLKPGGYFIIHDEFKDHESKSGLIARNNCSLINTIYLDETVWWDDYYDILHSQINELDDMELIGKFKGDMSEIEYYKADPIQFRSIYYLVRKNYS